MLTRAAHFAQAMSQWHVRSQQVSRRNALVACTTLAERRREVEEVEEFLERHTRARLAATTLEVEVRPA